MDARRLLLRLAFSRLIKIAPQTVHARKRHGVGFFVLGPMRQRTWPLFVRMRFLQALEIFDIDEAACRSPQNKKKGPLDGGPSLDRADQRLPPDFCGFANVAATEPDPAGTFAAAAFFGLRISLLERRWPLAIADLLGLRTHFAFLRGRPAECRTPPPPLPARIIRPGDKASKNKKARRVAGLSVGEAALGCVGA
jgi:hypothetical protein